MRRGKLIRAAVLLIGSCVFLYFFPLFHVRRLGTESADGEAAAASQATGKVADPATYVEAFWNGPLRKGVEVIEIVELWKALDSDAANAKKEFGRVVGLGGATYFCVRGRGTVESAEKNHCTVSLSDDARKAELQLGVIADNTVREAIGVNVNEFANSQGFNAVSSALNERIEAEVIEPNKSQLEPGAIVEFVGCAKVGGKSDLDPLKLVPIQIQVEGVEP